MPAKQRVTVISFWVPFAGHSQKKLGTRIEFTIDPDPNFSSFYISRLPEKRQREDVRITNGHVGMRHMYDKLNQHLQDLNRTGQVWLYFNVVSELMIAGQILQRVRIKTALTV